MKRTMFSAGVVLMTMVTTLLAVESDIDGAVPGKWTMDLDAAKKVAAEKKLPILLDFSGSDWCGWCKLMETDVFSKPEWSAWATNNIMMVLIDFPTDKSLVPEKYTERNEALSEQYGIEGFPTFILIDCDGQTDIGRLGAGRDKTPESFIAEINLALKNGPAAMEKFVASLSPEVKAAYEELAAKMKAAETSLEEQMKIMEDAQKKAEALQQSVAEMEEQMKLFRLEHALSAEDFAAYKETKAKYDAAIAKIQAWLATQPEENEENMKIFTEMRDEILGLEAELSKY